MSGSQPMIFGQPTGPIEKKEVTSSDTDVKLTVTSQNVDKEILATPYGAAQNLWPLWPWTSADCEQPQWLGWDFVHLTGTCFPGLRLDQVVHAEGLPTGQSCTNWHPNTDSKKGDCCCWIWVLLSFRRTFLVTC